MRWVVEMPGTSTAAALEARLLSMRRRRVDEYVDLEARLDIRDLGPGGMCGWGPCR